MGRKRAGPKPLPHAQPTPEADPLGRTGMRAAVPGFPILMSYIDVEPPTIHCARATEFGSRPGVGFRNLHTRPSFSECISSSIHILSCCFQRPVGDPSKEGAIPRIGRASHTLALRFSSPSDLSRRIGFLITNFTGHQITMSTAASCSLLQPRINPCSEWRTASPSASARW
ncbi:hypothetical protein EJ04DRAFT_130335 [Polyplosphaeria fusca]|uniref:Uncharacterized protein n=1 Tax=Polyplosphaeria fusca TaxID=682080 RepID=A0A9P4V294_9PLEO|nr:hypothetical protein EJ04DRAFT_130335 [Polyplosphaeria fusca]